jgi:hypothetical protein
MSKAVVARRASASALALIAAVVTIPAGLEAAEPEVDENAPGEVMINMPLQFVRFALDGKGGWENHTYVNNARTLVVMGLDRDEEHTIELRPRESIWEPATVVVKPGEYRITRVKEGKRTIHVFRATVSASFKRAAPAPAKAGDKPAAEAPPEEVPAEAPPEEDAIPKPVDKSKKKAKERKAKEKKAQEKPK